MKNFILKLSNALSVQLQTIDFEESDVIKKSQKSISCTKAALTQLKKFLLDYSFKNKEEEILFFKEIKPEFLSKMIYYTKVFNIESRRPTGSKESQEIYLRHELEKLTFFFNNHIEFYQYYRMESTHLDDRYFIRGTENINLYQDNLMFYLYPDFSTSHDYMVSEIIANDRLEVFLNKEIENLLIIQKGSSTWAQNGDFSNGLLQWTESKTALVELIYALYASGSINNGTCEIRELAGFFERAFNIRLSDIYRTFLEIKIRSIPTKYIDNLKSTLLKKIEEDY